ncbi:proteophosphoglycan ppg4 [Rhodotorula toruloides]|uniref:Proteophosphoglycan ppg4 n=1 Tax=Rhodotorula toruloides TaxID=5286 RepID=A0A511KDV1_RHOTO|nr:proteophosphoglycan ppg4 [Rhodotorula toruloides]
MKTGSSKPQATRYGDAPLKGCKDPPSTFAGTSAGFASLCKVRYCYAKPARNMLWNGVEGDVTREEIETALGMFNELKPLWANGQDNVLSTGYLGQAAHDAGLLYEVTGDIRALDVSIQVADNILALQNANTPGGGVTIWTGAKDSVWPPGKLNPPAGQLVYAGCEQGLIASNMVQAANYILKSPCLWNKAPIAGSTALLVAHLAASQVPPVFQGPTVFKESTTYYERALAYIKAADECVRSRHPRLANLLTPLLALQHLRQLLLPLPRLEPLDHLSIIQPNDPRWDLTGDSRKAGTPMPWNRRMLVLHGYIQLAIAHETPAAFDPQKTALYDTIVKQNVMDFLLALNEEKSVVNGKMTWVAGPSVSSHIDFIMMLTSRNSAVFGLSNYIGYTFANTFEYTISFGNGLPRSFSGLVTGDSSKKAYTVKYAGWSFYALWLPDWFRTVAQANVASGFRGRTWLAVPLLWTKHALAINDMTFWSGLFSSGFGVVVGTESTSSRGSSASGMQSASPRLAATPTITALTSLVLLSATILLHAT